MKTLRLILGDQLNQKHEWFKNTDDDIVYVMAEMCQETDYVMHHIQKGTGFFMAMRTFADWLNSIGIKLEEIEGYIRQILGGGNIFAECIGCGCLNSLTKMRLIINANCLIFIGMHKRR